MDIIEWGNKWLKEKDKHNYCELTKESIAWLNGENVYSINEDCQ